VGLMMSGGADGDEAVGGARDVLALLAHTDARPAPLLDLAHDGPALPPSFVTHLSFPSPLYAWLHTLPRMMGTTASGTCIVICVAVARVSADPNDCWC